MSVYSTVGIILCHRDFRESDRVITIFTREYGKLEMMAKGSRKISSKLAGSLEPFVITELNVVKGKSLDTITASQIIENFKSIKAHYDKLLFANHLVEIVDDLIKVHFKEERIFKLIEDTFRQLENNGHTEMYQTKMKWFFCWRLLWFLGYGPQLYKCVSCRQTLKEYNNYFSFLKGGILCEKCKLDGEAKISSEAIKVIRLLVDDKWMTINRLNLKGVIIREINLITDKNLKYIMERDLRVNPVVKNRII